MRIPFSTRSVDLRLPTVAGSAKVTEKLFIDSLVSQLPENFDKTIEAVVQLSPDVFRVTYKVAQNMEELCNLGLTFLGSPISCRQIRTTKWVRVARLSYGVPCEAITDALKPFGSVLNVKMDQHKGINMGTRNVLMEVRLPIPSKLLISGH